MRATAIDFDSIFALYVHAQRAAIAAMLLPAD